MKESYLTDTLADTVDNYAQVCENWRLIFLKMNQSELIERFHWQADENMIYIRYYNEQYLINRRTGMIFLENDEDRKLPFNTVMSIYGLLYYSKPGAKIRGEFVPYRLVKRAAPFAPAFQKTVVDVLAKSFAGKADVLEQACIALGGEKQKQGDVGYRLKAFDCIPVEVYFWDEDEEFPAQANILFDADITDFLHEESVCCIGADAVRRLCEEGNLAAEHLLGDIVSESR